MTPSREGAARAKQLLREVHAFVLELECPPSEATDIVLSWPRGEARACADGAVWCCAHNGLFDVRITDMSRASGHLARFDAMLAKR